jgi:uncharacterized membrane protein YeiH
MATLLVALDLLGTFVFALSGALVGVRHRLDLFGAVAALAGAAVVVVGDLIGLPAPAVAVGGALVCFGLRMIGVRRGWKLPTPREPASVDSDSGN